MQTGKNSKPKKISITIPLELAETLQGFIDGGIGTSSDDDFTRQMNIVLKNLSKAIDKHYKPCK